MQNAYSNPKLERTTLIRLSHLYIYSILGHSVLLPIIRFINHKFTPPFSIVNKCNNISVNEQANVAGVHQLLLCPYALYSLG